MRFKDLLNEHITYKPLIAIVGPTACGKTGLAVNVAHAFDGEILSGDSRQVYRRMDIGTGKDLFDYVVDGNPIPYHLIDIAEPGSKYNVYKYQHDFLHAYEDVCRRGKQPVLCGGSGLYVESVLRGYRMSYVPENKPLRESLSHKSLEELTSILAGYKSLHNTTDVDTAQRAIRAIEIAEYYRCHPDEENAGDGLDNHEKQLLKFIQEHSIVVGIDIPRDFRRSSISRRLQERLENGMVEEVQSLLSEGIPADNLIYYGLEYKYVTLYVQGKLTYGEMYRQLEIAIHQFAKRQMTWFRGMERRGVPIHWIDYSLDMSSKLSQIRDLLKFFDEN